MKEKKQPWGKFYFSDWRADPRLRMCSLAARGLWMEMLALMHESEPRGYLVVNDREVSPKQLASLSGCTLKEAEAGLSELEEAGVFSRDDDAMIYSRRMVRDTEKAEKDRANGKGGGNPQITKQVNGRVNPDVNGVDKAQRLEARDQNLSDLTVARPKRVRTRIGYSDEFEELWRQYPTDALMSKKDAFAAWQRLSEDDQQAVMRSLPAFKAHCGANADYRPVHLVRYLTQRRFDGFASLEQRVSTAVFVRQGTPQWEAWDRHYRQTQGKGPPCVNEGWRFPTEWPPETHGHAA